MTVAPVRLSEVCQIVMGQAPDGEAYNEVGDGWPLVAGAGDFGEGIPAPKKFTTIAPRRSNRGDIIFGVRATIGEKVWSDGEYCLGRGVAALRAGPDVLPRFLWHWLDQVRPVLDRKARGATFKQVTREDIAELDFCRLSMLDQERIASILDKADAIRQKRREILKLADEFPRSAFLDLFGDPVTNSKGWPKVLLGDYVEFMTSGSRGWAEYYAESGAAFLRIQNVGRNRLLLDDLAFVDTPDTTEARRTLVQPGDLLVSITADLGRCAVVPDDLGRAHINQHLALIRLRELSPIFVSGLLDSEAGRRQFARLNREGVKAGLNFDDLRSLELLMPPITLQRKYEAMLRRARGLEQAFNRQLGETEQLFGSLQYRAFNGELAARG